MLPALVLTTLIDSLSLGPRPMACLFPAVEPQQKPIEIIMSARPSLKDLPGLYRVEMDIDGTDMNGAAQPIVSTAGKDVMVRASIDDTTFYAIGFDEDGAAALNIVWIEAGKAVEQQTTRRGFCRDYERYLHTWSAS